ncbi:MAG: hypothetical protein ACREMF_02270 [Gemmatimonadales bacterium]
MHHQYDKEGCWSSPRPPPGLALGIERDYGSIEEGKVVDILVLGADPSADIRRTRAIVFIVKGGTVHRP